VRIILERRPEGSAGIAWRGTVVSVLLALLMEPLFSSRGCEPFKAYAVMGLGAFGSLYNVSEVLVKAIPLIFCGLCVALSAKILLWNIGAEGQLAWEE